MASSLSPLRAAASLRRALSSAVLASALFAPAMASAQTPIVLEATVPEATPRYFTVPFVVPEGIREIEVRHDDLSSANILDWGLRDPARFRGWGGGNTEPAIVAETAASRSYVAGAIPAGTWNVMIGLAKVTERPARYRIEITLRTTQTLAPQPERRPYAHSPALATARRWYAGDFHVHSRESGDASPSLDAIATFARMRGLDFVELSEHNVVTANDFIADAQGRHRSVLLVPGMEFTTYGGHANAIGATQWVDFTPSTGPSTSARAAVDAITAQGALFAINHPTLDIGDACIGCSWSLDVQPERIAAIELQNGQYSQTGPLFYRPTVTLWESYLNRGLHVAPIGGSDDHRAGGGTGMFESPVGGPTTMVFADELSVPAILAAVRAGRTVVKLQGPTDPMIDLRAGEALLGDTIRTRDATLRATVTGGMGSTLRFLRNGVLFRDVAVDRDPFESTLDVRAPAGARDDRWRCDLVTGGRPRVVTGHLWVAATGEAPDGDVPDASAMDARVEAPDSAVMDAIAMDSSLPVDAGVLRVSGGCGCRTLPRSARFDKLGVLLLAGVALSVRARSRAAREATAPARPSRDRRARSRT